MTLWQAVAQGGAFTLLLTLTASAQVGKIQDRIPLILEEPMTEAEQRYQRFREAADKLHKEVEEMKRLEAEGKLQKPYRGLVSPDDMTCRPKKRLNIPPVLS
jgi:hypothetical protein